MVTIRELITKFGFDVDDSKLKSMDRNINDMKSSIRSLLVVVGAASAGIGYLLNEAGKQEQTSIAYETLIGNVELAHKTLKELYAFAAETPFTIPQVEESGKKLLAYGIAVDKLIPTLDILGNVAAGVGIEKLPYLTLALGQVYTRGKLMGSELRQFTENGVGIIEAISKLRGIPTKKLMDASDIASLNISYEEVVRALQTLPAVTGNLMQRQSLTWLGILSNIGDKLRLLARALGDELLPAAKQLGNEFLTWMAANEKLIKQDLTKFIKTLAKSLLTTFSIIKQIGGYLGVLVKAIGGIENATKAVLFWFSIFTGFKILAGIYALNFAITSAIVAITQLGIAAAFANAMFFLLPAAIVILAAALEDVYRYFKGDKSITGLWIDAIREKIEKLTRAVDDFKNVWNGSMLQATFRPFDFISQDINKKVESNKNVPANALERWIGIASKAPAPQPNITISSPITVNVPKETNLMDINKAITDGLSTAIYDMLDSSYRINSPVMVQ